MAPTNGILSRYRPEQSNLLHILHDFQNNSEQNYISEGDIREIAEYLKISLASVYGVVTYYSMFSAKPRGRFVVRACNSPVCCMSGADRLVESIKKVLEIDVGETTKDGRFTLEVCGCLGRCSAAPTLMINDDIYEDLNGIKLRSLFDQYQ